MAVEGGTLESSMSVRCATRLAAILTVRLVVATQLLQRSSASEQVSLSMRKQ
jgi:hypothetical protein